MDSTPPTPPEAPARRPGSDLGTELRDSAVLFGLFLVPVAVFAALASTVLGLGGR